jgi:amino acid transporter
VPAWALIASGLFVVLSGVFPGDFENRTSLTMIVHAVGSIGTFVMFLVAAFSLPRVLHRFREWRPFVWPSLVLAGGSIVMGFLRTGNAPGLGQRLAFACFFLWVALVGHALYCDPAQSDHAA